MMLGKLPRSEMMMLLLKKLAVGSQSLLIIRKKDIKKNSTNLWINKLIKFKMIIKVMHIKLRNLRAMEKRFRRGMRRISMIQRREMQTP